MNPEHIELPENIKPIVHHQDISVPFLLQFNILKDEHEELCLSPEEIAQAFQDQFKEFNELLLTSGQTGIEWYWDITSVDYILVIYSEDITIFLNKTSNNIVYINYHSEWESNWAAVSFKTTKSMNNAIKDVICQIFIEKLLTLAPRIRRKYVQGRLPTIWAKVPPLDNR